MILLILEDGVEYISEGVRCSPNAGDMVEVRLEKTALALIKKGQAEEIQEETTEGW